ncbi:helix-turn-helix domain-containing protein [Bowmanella yangjiangensis]|uniref:Helix-turn-helix transcriptional regulator n=1 Tax=Bowmanella yangjiangensis TaxID=2811230 RepID=A0ABS3CRT4_9ALTE|nr:AraC family transcriptional regulator [Bowmanella yangjiangensis]MBN7819818.1 helix-turn-helix transcriptional regulator [Bowmanella yangjiangensis]
MDTLNEILSQISLQADVVFAGELYGTKHFDGSGFIHLIESGSLSLTCRGHRKLDVCKPCVLFFPSNCIHTLVSQDSDPPKLVSAAIKLDSMGAALVNAMPSFIYFELCQNSTVTNTIQWLFNEVFEERFGRQTMIERLSDIFILQVLREATQNGVILQGVLSAATHPQLSKVIEVIHGKPAENWTVESLASIAAMSRSKFAASFRRVIGQTPNDYITDIRLGLAQKLLKKNKSIGFVAGEVGYEHGSALARVFRKKLGMSPREWLQTLR